MSSDKYKNSGRTWTISMTILFRFTVYVKNTRTNMQLGSRILNINIHRRGAICHCSPDYSDWIAEELQISSRYCARLPTHRALSASTFHPITGLRPATCIHIFASQHPSHNPHDSRWNVRVQLWSAFSRVCVCVFCVPKLYLLAALWMQITKRTETHETHQQCWGEWTGAHEWQRRS